MSVGRPFFTFISLVRMAAAKMHKSERTKRAQVSMLTCPRPMAYLVPSGIRMVQDGRRNRWQMLSGNPLARQHIAHRGEIVKETENKERNGKDGRRREKKKYTVDRWNRVGGGGDKKEDLERHKRRGRGERKGWKEEERRRKWNRSRDGSVREVGEGRRMDRWEKRGEGGDK